VLSLQGSLSFTDEKQEFPPEDLPLLSAQCRLPRLEGACRFNRYYDAYRRAFFTYCRKVLLPMAQAAYALASEQGGAIPAWQITLDTTVTLEQFPLLSLYTDTAECLDGKRTVLRRADTWDLSADAPLPAGALFPAGVHWRRALLREVSRQIRRQIADGVSLYHPDWRRRLYADFSAERIYLTPESLCLYYQMYAIAPAVEGVPVFRVPYDEELGPRLPLSGA